MESADSKTKSSKDRRQPSSKSHHSRRPRKSPVIIAVILMTASRCMCRFQQATCYNCCNVGHIAPACRLHKTNLNRLNRRNSPEHTKFVELETTDSEQEELPLFIGLILRIKT